MKLKELSFFAVVAALCFTGCKEEEPSQIPTVPTTFSLEDGAVVQDLTLTLSCGGSTVEDDGCKIKYEFFIGKSENSLELTNNKVTLEPYTQYFWCTRAASRYTDGSGEYGEMSAVRTFYCVPPIELTSDNGDGEWAAVIRWEKNDKIKNVTISATPDHAGYSLESQTVDGCQDSCCFKTTTPQNNAYTHPFDDKNGVYYEPVIYTFNVEAKVQVGDKLCTALGSINEILLNKQLHVRDHEFNVYRVVKNGDQTWLADDLRATSYIDENCEVVKLEEGKDFVYSTLKSGATGVLYRVNSVAWTDDSNRDGNGYSTCKLRELWESLDKIQFAPKGYDLPTDEDFFVIERKYDLPDVTIQQRHKQSYIYDPIYFIEDSVDADYGSRWSSANRLFEADDKGIMLFMASPYDWENVTEIPTQGWFNSKPFGMGSRDTLKKTQGKGVVYLTKPSYKDDWITCFVIRVFSNKHKGIARIVSYDQSADFISLRCIRK